MSQSLTITESAAATPVREASSLRSRVAPWLVWGASLLLAFEVGGGFYEHLVLDRAWPSNLALIQPGHGGASRAPFWMVVHSLLTMVLLAALWASWRNTAMRRRLSWTLGIHVALRAWTFAYFIPAALRFEAAQAIVPEEARTWVMLSPIRTAATFVALAILWRPADAAGTGQVASRR